MVNKVICVCIALVLLVAACSEFREPQMPTWDISLEDIPLLKADTLTISELLSDSTIVAEGPDSLVHVKLTGETSFDVGEELEYDGTSTSFDAEIGNFSVDVGSGDEVQFGFKDVFPELSDLHGTSQVIPGKSLPAIEKDYSNFTNFQTATFASGYLKVRIQNDLAITLGDPISLELIDNNTQMSIGTLNYGKITSFSSEEQSMDLSGKTISNNMKFRLTGQTLGSEGNTVTIDVNSSFTIYVSFENLVASSAEAKIPNQTFVSEDKISVSSETYTLNVASVESGGMKFSFNNRLSFPINIDLKVGSIVSVGGDTLTVSMYLNPYSQESYNVDLTDYIIKPVNDSLSYRADVYMQTDPHSFTSVNSSDYVSIDVQISELVFSEVNADVNFSIDFPEIDEELFEEPPDQLKNFSLDDVRFVLIFDNMPGDLDVDVSVIAIKSGVENRLPIRFTIAQGVRDSVILDKNGVNNDNNPTTIVDLLNDLPQRIRVSGSIQLTGDDVILRKEEELGIEYRVKVPFKFSLMETSIEDTLKLDLDEDARDAIRDNLVSASISGTIVNNTPLGGEVMMSGGDSVLGVYTDILINPVGFDVANLNSEGLTTSPKETNFNVELTKDKFEVLANSNSLIINVTLYDVNKGALRSTDYIIIKNIKFSGTGRVYVKEDEE